MSGYGLKRSYGLAGFVDVRKSLFKVLDESSVVVKDFLGSIGLFLLLFFLTFSFYWTELFFRCAA
ncbi:uncharacterized protein K452DRAFT_301159 [Aplosporella prunicola CBS 121167]|uniref:Uncharacterized protein n=1 Tax=Aplosporella prunicola CBS 121167 TaxID=1176127 RepID=A0A6A6B5C7_9PEZI|nr:uncharacterized protein K452DRAFT_301159 [Aplosporella prunicola CBS 121167]KAF2138187.1 hypothetical protein K452DRAFT_301159 [Aplosporella prunicola CBS 121167]